MAKINLLPWREELRKQKQQNSSLCQAAQQSLPP
jgi:Tfp pilus assembly protein PilN